MLYIKTFVLGNGTSFGALNVSVFVVKESGKHQLIIRGGSTASVIQAVKFELGERQTLAKKNTSGEWEIIDPPNYDLQYLLTSQYSPINYAYVGIQHSNPNLLDNWYFVDPINQRGETEYDSILGYGIDRWTSIGHPITTIIQSDSVKLIFIETGGMWSQKVPTYGVLTGELTLTFSVIVKNIVGNVRMNIGDARLSEGLNVGVLKTSVSPNNYRTIYIWGDANSSCEIIAAKLELGPVQTLARKEGDIWVLNDPPPNKQQELAKCQRYLQPINGMQAGIDDSFDGLMRFTSNDKTIEVRSSFELATPMRATPTIVNYDGKARIVPWNSAYTSNVSVIQNVALEVWSSSNKRINIFAKKTSETAFDTSVYGRFGQFDFLNCTTTPLLSAEL